MEGHLQKNSILSFVFGWFQGIRNLGGFLKNLLIFQAEIIPLSPLFFDFNILPYGLEESKEL